MLSAAAHVAERLDRVLGLPYVTVTPQVMPLQPDQASPDAAAPQHAHAHADGMANGLYHDQARGPVFLRGWHAHFCAMLQGAFAYEAV